MAVGVVAQQHPAAFIDELERGVQGLCDFIDDILVSEAMEGGSTKCELVDVDLGPLLEDALAPAVDSARVRGIPFQARCAPGLLVHVDPGRAVAVLRRVAENAVRFTETGQVSIDVENRGAELALHVRATNDGLPAGVELVVARRPLEAQGLAITAECSLNVRWYVCLTLPAPRP